MFYKKLIITLIPIVLFSCGRNQVIKPPVNPPIVNPSAQPNQPISGNPDTPPVIAIEDIYAPILYFDSLEKQPLTSVESYLNLGTSLEGRKGIGRYKSIKSPVTLKDLSDNTKQKINIENSDYEIYLQTKDQVSKYDQIVYTRKTIKNNITYLQYWFFYSYNDIKGTGGINLIHKCGNHQADWEHISIKINNSSFQSAKNDTDYLKAIEGVYFSQHNKGQHDERKFRKYGDKEISFESSHIKTYPGRGTHASYSEPSPESGYPLVNLLGMKLTDKADGKGIALKTEGHLSSLENASWSKFGGKWGKISDDICNLAEWFSSASNDGPIGPLQQNSGIDWDKEK